MSSRKCAFGGVAAAIFLWVLCVPTHGMPQVEPAKQRASALEFPGQVEASEQANLHTRISAFVQQLHVDIGDRVKKGQVLADLSAPELEADQRQKAALIALAEAEVELSRLGVQVAEAALDMTSAQAHAAEASIKRARANLEYRKTEFERVERAWQDKVIDKQVLDEKRHQVEAARAGLAEAEAKGQAIKASQDGSIAKRGKSKAELKVTEARLQLAKTDLQRLDTMLQLTKVKAPFDGVIIRRNVATGSFARSGDAGNVEPLLVMMRVDSVRVAVNVPESAIASVRPGTPASVRVPALKGTQVEAKITRVAGALDAQTRTLRAEIDLPNPDGKLLPGMFAAVTIKGLTADETKKER